MTFNQFWVTFGIIMHWSSSYLNFERMIMFFISRRVLRTHDIFFSAVTKLFFALICSKKLRELFLRNRMLWPTCSTFWITLNQAQLSFIMRNISSAAIWAKNNRRHLYSCSKWLLLFFVHYYRFHFSKFILLGFY